MRSRLVRMSPMGACLLDAGELAGSTMTGPSVMQVTLHGNAWFNLYLVGAGARDMDGPLSLMHVK
jgi:hypothetical protein